MNSLCEDERFLGEQTEAAEHTHLVLEALLLGAAPGRFICLQCVWAVTLGALLPEAGSSRTHTSQPLGRAYRSCVIQFHSRVRLTHMHLVLKGLLLGAARRQQVLLVPHLLLHLQRVSTH